MRQAFVLTLALLLPLPSAAEARASVGVRLQQAQSALLEASRERPPDAAACKQLRRRLDRGQLSEPGPGKLLLLEQGRQLGELAGPRDALASVDLDGLCGWSALVLRFPRAHLEPAAAPPTSTSTSTAAAPRGLALSPPPGPVHSLVVLLRDEDIQLLQWLIGVCAVLLIAAVVLIGRRRPVLSLDAGPVSVLPQPLDVVEPLARQRAENERLQALVREELAALNQQMLQMRSKRGT